MKIVYILYYEAKLKYILKLKLKLKLTFNIITVY